MPTFSVIVPTYNRAHLLPRCLQSLSVQTFSDFEIIVVDDGSTDNTKEIMEAAANRDGRIRYVRQSNKGAGEARNLGAKVGIGEYLTFLDSDDEVLPQWLALIHQVIDDHGVELVCCGIALHDAAGRCIQRRVPETTRKKVPPVNGLYRSGTFAIRRNVFETVGGYASSLAANQHSELRCRLELYGRQTLFKAFNLPDVLVRAHDHAGPKIRRNTSDIFQSALYVLNNHGTLLRENPSTFSNWASACAGAAAKLGRYRDARTWFWRAIRANPGNARNYARYLVACSPGLRTLIWHVETNK